MTRRKSNYPRQQQKHRSIISTDFMNDIYPLTDNQQKLFDYYDEGKNIVAHGSSGSGKTICVLYKAMKEVLDPATPYEKVIIMKNMVQSYELGFLSGSLESKIAPFEDPYQYMVKKMFDLQSDEEYEMLYGKLKSEKIIEFSCVSFLRGTTFDNCILIVDEFQNMNGHILSTVITRVGVDCKIFFVGDNVQTDLRNEKDRQGFGDFMQIIEKMPSFESVKFNIDDCVRSGIAREFLFAQHDLGIIL
jgi:phosphate starvation-inducible PhoH-like protein